MENNNHKVVLALKYRPQNFKELIGQSITASTLINSIKSNRIANAFLLIGSVGTGKTSTARILSKALTCTGSFLEGIKCKTGICHCEEITNDKHLDVTECDAASRTGVDDIREIIESARYKPTTAKYKIYIIDECQMLSRSAWNALLKTLEEPPPSLKFIFCTTEPKKVPVTIKSRCQTFFLHKVAIKVLFDHLKKISEIENGKISDSAIKLISRASAGSVRDALSLLDRALITQHDSEKEVDETKMRAILGIADRSKILELLKFIFDGDQKKSIKSLRQMIDGGIDTANLKNDILELLHFMLQKKNLGDFDSDLNISESELEMIDLISKDVSTSTLILFWQFTLKSLDEDKLLTNLPLGLEMLVIRLLHLKEMPSYEDLVKSVSNQTDEVETAVKITKRVSNEEGEISNISKDQIKNTTQAKPELTSLTPKGAIKENIKSFEDLIKLTSTKKEIHLKYDLENNVNLIKFSEGKIDISFNENLDKNFVRNLSEKLLEWTGIRWLITLANKPGQKTFSELQDIKIKKLLDQEKNGEIYKKFKNIFSDGELLEVKKKD